MYLKISYDGQIISIDCNPYINVQGNIYLDRSGCLLLYINEDAYPRYDSNGRISSIGGTSIYYRGYTDYSFEQGKLKNIGSVSFYYRDSTSNTKEEVGKIKTIGGVSIYYCTYNDSSNLLGKPKQVGGRYIYYDSYGNVNRIS
ncbi:MAG: hypothetical protein K5925_03610 [Bacilli bacterium]|nr:hypothetical protein [Bacilli bacterium]